MNISASEFVKQYCKKSGITERQFYETQIPMPDPSSPYGWSAVSNSAVSVKAHVKLVMTDLAIMVPKEMTDEMIRAVSRNTELGGWARSHLAGAFDLFQEFWKVACLAAMHQVGNSPVIQDCWCRTCRPVVLNDMRFLVCPDCGNKRCPRANDHRNACTGSNEPGQEGSAYPTAPQEVKGE